LQYLLNKSRYIIACSAPYGKKENVVFAKKRWKRQGKGCGFRHNIWKSVTLYFKLQFVELTLEMQNSECKMQNCCIFFENNSN